MATSSGHVRIGDAERAEMSDLLGKHYGDGRLDEQEFRARMDQAMSAKTRSDLEGLLADLPNLGPGSGGVPLSGEVQPPAPSSSRRGHLVHRPRVLRLALIVLVALWLTHVVLMPWQFVAPHLGSLVVLGFAVIFLLGGRRRHHAFSRRGPRSGTGLL